MPPVKLEGTGTLKRYLDCVSSAKTLASQSLASLILCRQSSSTESFNRQPCATLANTKPKCVFQPIVDGISG